MDKLLKDLNYIGYYDDCGNYIIEIGEDAIVELIKRITNADKVDVIKIKER